MYIHRAALLWACLTKLKCLESNVTMFYKRKPSRNKSTLFFYIKYTNT